jgi:predicted amidohydrolase YtcJ
MDENLPAAKSITIEKGIITDISRDRNLTTRNGDHVMDFEGATLFPGFNDSHLHLLSFGKALNKVDLNGVRSIEELKKKTRQFIQARKIPEGEWVMGRGWDQELFAEQRHLTARDLDEVSDRHPIVLTRRCGHYRIVNSYLLKMMGVDGNQTVSGGKIFVDESNKPTGLFAEQGCKNLIYNVQPEPTSDQIKKMIVQASERLRKAGLTSVQTDDFEAVRHKDNYNLVMQAYFELSENDSLPVKCNHQLHLRNLAQLQDFLNTYRLGPYDTHLNLGPLKIETDGSLGGWTAALRSPYSDKPEELGHLNFSRQELTEMIRMALKNNMQIAYHAIGDLTIEIFLDILTELQPDIPDLLRPRIIHCQVTDADLIKRMSKLSVCADVQPLMVGSDWKMAMERLGPDRILNTYAWKTLLENRIVVAGGSDTPVEDFNPLKGIGCALTRQDHEGMPPAGWHPWERVSLWESLAMYTKYAAYVCYEEANKGTISIGKAADITVLKQDPAGTALHEIQDIDVRGTFIHGKWSAS